MKVRFVAFTEAGLRQAHRLGACLPQGAEADIACGFGPEKVSLAAWTAQAFSEADALIFVGAAGIAVRAIAPHARSKTTDPAVVVVDEAGVGRSRSYRAIWAARTALRAFWPRVSARRRFSPRRPMVRGLWAVDDWAAARGMAIANPARIKRVSSRLLAGGRVSLACDLPLRGAAPEGVDAIALGKPSAADSAESSAEDGRRFDIVVSPFSRACADEVLCVVPRRVVVGIGCRRGTAEGSLAKAVDEALERAGVLPQAVREVRSIDLKNDEEGLLSLAERRGWSVRFYSAEELRAVEGSFARSAFVEQVAGIDNVCERAAAACGETVAAAGKR